MFNSSFIHSAFLLLIFGFGFVVVVVCLLLAGWCVCECVCVCASNRFCFTRLNFQTLVFG